VILENVTLPNSPFVFMSYSSGREPTRRSPLAVPDLNNHRAPEERLMARLHRRRGMLIPMSESPTAFMRRYEQATNRHDFTALAPLIASDAVYWFTDGSYRGRPAIEEAVSQTFSAIQDEVYEIRDLEWVLVGEESAVCRYRFHWTGVVEGKPASGQGRGTNVLTHRGGRWQMLHEHLSGA
jgi:ketosteroid isomerase-like protein